MSGYTSTTDEVREAVVEWGWSRRMFRPELEASDGKEFDRWLSSVKAEAWDEGAKWAAVECAAITAEDAAWIVPGDNPYRLEQS